MAIVNHKQMRDLLLPALRAQRSDDFIILMSKWEQVFPSASIWSPSVTVVQAVALGAAATVIKNPTVSRRFWA